MPTTKPDPAAVEAARKIAELVDGYAKLRDPRAPEMSQERCAAIIESTTHVGELREALQRLTRQCRQNSYCVVCGRSRVHEDNCWVPRAESVLAELPKG